MPSIIDHQQTSTNRNKMKQTLTSQQSQRNSSTKTNQSGRTPSNEITFIDPINQAILIFEKKQRNLGKRKEKLESYQQEAKNGKELNKDQKEALDKYGEVIGQIECIKDISEQFKKIQNESSKNQKRLQKQIAEEKRSLVHQRLREFSQLRYLLDHRPSSLTQDDQLFLDELHSIIIPTDFSLIHRSVEIVLSIYHNHSSNIKLIQQRNNQEIKDKIEELIQVYQKTFENNQTIDSTTTNSSIKEEIQRNSQSNSTTLNHPSNDSNQTQSNSSEVLITSLAESTSNQEKVSNSISLNSNEYPFQLDTRNQNVSLKEILEDSPFFSLEINNQQDLKQEHFNDSQQYSQTITIINSDLTNSITTQQTFNQDSTLTLTHEKLNQTNDQENSLTKKVNSNLNYDDEQPIEEQWQQRRTNSGNNHRLGQYQTNGNRNSSRGSSNHYHHHQQQWRGSSRENQNLYQSNYNEQRQQYHENINQQQRTNPNNRSLSFEKIVFLFFSSFEIFEKKEFIDLDYRNQSGFYRGQSNGSTNENETLLSSRNRSTNLH